MKLFVSYRRKDSLAITGRLVDRLSARFGRDSVFLDIHDIPIGKDFREHIRGTVEGSDVVLAIIGADCTGKLEGGWSRFGEPDDPVRLEIEMARQLDVPVIPVLVDNAAMPGRGALPESLLWLEPLNAAPIDPGRNFDVDVDRLVEAVATLAGVEIESSVLTSSAPGPSRGALAFPILLGVVCLAVPIVASRTSISTPWPRESTLVTLLVMAILGAAFFELLRSLHDRWTTVGVAVGALVMTVGAVAYLVGVAGFSYQQPGVAGLWAKGYVCTEEAVLVYGDKCPDLGLDELSSVEFQEDRLWTSRSIAVVKFGLASAWFAAHTGASWIVVGLLVRALGTRKRRSGS